ncbi:MAG: DinB family protein [Anaerolineae bacterium]|nr:DinB family protein [Anaerolineae bacterium]
MQAKEILRDLLESQQKGINSECGELSADVLNWRPDAAANSIGITIWHLARVADFVFTHRLEGRPIEEQRWFSDGWAEKTGYDPRGLGAGGMGILTGYNQEEVAALPNMSGEELLAYHNTVYAGLLAHLAELTDEGLDGPVPGEGQQRTVYFWYRVVLLDATRHLGEMQALKAMWARR